MRRTAKRRSGTSDSRVYEADSFEIGRSAILMVPIVVLGRLGVGALARGGGAGARGAGRGVGGGQAARATEDRSELGVERGEWIRRWGRGLRGGGGDRHRQHARSEAGSEHGGVMKHRPCHVAHDLQAAAAAPGQGCRPALSGSRTGSTVNRRQRRTDPRSGSPTATLRPMADPSPAPMPPAQLGPALARTGAVWRGTRNDLILATASHGTSPFSMPCSASIASALIALFLWRGGYPTWRIVAPLGMFVVMVMAQVVALSWARRNPPGDRAFVLLHITSQVYLFGVTTVTGGVYSPMLPVLGITAVLPIVFFGVNSASRALTASALTLFVLMAALPRADLGPALPHDQYATVAVIGFVWATLIVNSFVRRVHQATLLASVDGGRAQSEERVAVAAEQMCRCSRSAPRWPTSSRTRWPR
jgi:hypothetical protein